MKATSRVPDLTPQYAASDLGLHCMYTCTMRTSARVCMGINVCLRVGTCVHTCMCVLVACVCPFSICVYVYVRDYSHALLLTSNVGVHAFACTSIDQHRC